MLIYPVKSGWCGIYYRRMPHRKGVEPRPVLLQIVGQVAPSHPRNLVVVCRHGTGVSSSSHTIRSRTSTRSMGPTPASVPLRSGASTTSPSLAIAPWRQALHSDFVCDGAVQWPHPDPRALLLARSSGSQNGTLSSSAAAMKSLTCGSRQASAHDPLAGSVGSGRSASRCRPSTLSDISPTRR